MKEDGGVTQYVHLFGDDDLVDLDDLDDKEGYKSEEVWVSYSDFCVAEQRAYQEGFKDGRLQGRREVEEEVAERRKQAMRLERLYYAGYLGQPGED